MSARSNSSDQSRTLHFVCVGPQKTGTSWLDRMLRQHPAIQLPRTVKETFFFDERFDRGLVWYWAHFQHAGMARIAGEVAPSYFDVSAAAARLRKLNPDLKIVVCLRDPTERAYSLFCHHYARGRLRGTFGDAIKRMPRILESGRYLTHVRRWVELFGRDNLLFIDQQAIRKQPRAVLSGVCRFLGIEPIAWSDADEAVYARAAPRSLALAGLASRASALLRRHDQHWLVDLVRSSGLRRLVFGAANFAYPALEEADRIMLLDFYEPEYQWLASLTFDDGVLLGPNARFTHGDGA